MSCDIRIASENARFGLPELALSIIPDEPAAPSASPGSSGRAGPRR